MIKPLTISAALDSFFFPTQYNIYLINSQFTSATLFFRLSESSWLFTKVLGKIVHSMHDVKVEHEGENPTCDTRDGQYVSCGVIEIEKSLGIAFCNQESLHI